MIGISDVYMQSIIESVGLGIRSSLLNHSMIGNLILQTNYRMIRH